MTTYIVHAGRTLRGVQLLAFLCALICASPVLRAAKQAAGVIPPSSITVKDFGARGDGKTDDTAAIQAAAVAAAKRSAKQNMQMGHIEFQPRPEIVFPPGTYRITGPIAFERQAVVRGIGDATIVQSDPKADIFYFSVSKRRQRRTCAFFVTNLHFQGGRTQLRFWTNNSGGGARVLVDRCTFTDSGDDAIVCRSYGKPGWSTKRYLSLSHKEKIKALKAGIYWRPYLLETVDGKVTLKPNPKKRGPIAPNSTLEVISNSRFDHCMGVANLSGDMVVICEDTVVANPQQDGPVFDLQYGEFELTGLHCTAEPRAGKQLCWIQSGGRMAVRDSTFASSRGVDFIRMFREHNRGYSPTRRCVVVDRCRVHTAGGPDNAVVSIPSGNQPTILSLSRVTETSGKPVKAIAWEYPKAAFPAKGHAFEDFPRPALFKIALADNSENIATALPDFAKPLRVKPVPVQAVQQTDVPELDWDYQNLEKGVSTVLYAGEHGVDDNPKTDDTAAFQKLFDAAKAPDGAGSSLVIIPAGVYRLSRAIRLPANVLVRAAGMAAFMQTDPKSAMFIVKDARVLGFKNVAFQGGRRGFDITTAASTHARIAFDACWTTQQHLAVRCMAGQGKIGEENHAQLRFSRGNLSDVAKAVVTNASRSQIDSSWMADGKDLDGAYIVNLGGEMRLQGMLGNPRVHRGGKISEDPRWIDNFGRLYVADVRFGGEAGGFCNVYHRSKGGTVYIGGGLSRFYNAATKKCALYLEQDPKVAVLRNISSVVRNTGRFEGGSIYARPAERAGQANVFVAGVLTPHRP